MSSHTAPFRVIASGGPDEIPSSAPPEVLDAIAEAAEIYDGLQASGREVRFGTDATGRLSASLCDTDGSFLTRLSARQVIELATGGPQD